MAIPTFTTRSYRELVLAADPDFHFESRHPVVYLWPRNGQRRDPGDGGGPYANSAHDECGWITEPASETWITEDGQELWECEDNN